MKSLFRITASALIVASALSASAQSNVQKTAAEAAEAIANAPFLLIIYTQGAND